MKKILYLSLAMLMISGAKLYSSGDKTPDKDCLAVYGRKGCLDTEERAKCKPEQLPELDRICQQEIDKLTANAKTKAEKLAAEKLAAEVRLAEEERKKAEAEKAKIDIQLKAGCEHKEGEKTVLTPCKGADYKFDCASNRDGLFQECPSSNAVGQKWQNPINMIDSKEFINLRKITKSTPISGKISMPEKEKMIGFTYIPTTGKFSGTKIWCIIFDDYKNQEEPGIKIYCTKGPRLTEQTEWTEMGHIGYEPKNYDKQINQINVDINKHRGIIIESDGRMTLDFLATGPNAKEHLVLILPKDL